METKLIAMVVGVVLVLATIYTQSVFALGRNNGGNGGNGAVGGAGTTDGQPEHGLANACLHAPHNPHCGQTPTGGVKPVEGWKR